MPSPESHSQIVDNSIADIVQKFNEGTETTQRAIFNKVNQLIKDLSLNPDGSIKQTTANMKILNRIRATIEPAIITDAYKGRVNRFLNGFDEVKGLSDGYLAALTQSFQPSKLLYKQVLEFNKEITFNSLLESGINKNVIDPIKELIQTNVTSGGNYGDLVDSLRDQIKGIPDERLGSLQSYSKQIATDSLNQFSANYENTVSADLGLEWYYYSSGLRSTSRRYCRKRAGKYFHKKEVEDSARERWSGKIPATNASTIFRYRGGYNCDHRFHPSDLGAVPKSVVERNIANGNYKP